MGKYNFDYIIIGSGPAGSTAALKLAKSKKRIAIVESRNLGGTNLNTRDIPYLINTNFSHAFSNLSKSPEINGLDLHYNLPTLISHQENIISKINLQNQELFNRPNITILNGHAHFIDNHTVAVGKDQYSASNFIIATGSKLNTGQISGLESVNYLTPETAIKLRRLPKFALIIGGGPTGCELAEYYAELGAKVIIMEQANRLLPQEDEDTANLITDYFVNELGIMVVPNSKVVAIEQDNISKRVIFSTSRQEKVVRIDCIILATGSVPYTDIGLENADVKYKESGIVVNKLFQTSAKNIYAIGDCIGGKSSTERAEYQASILAVNLLKKSKNIPNYTGFIDTINTYPEIATIGLNESKLLALKRKYKKSIIYLKDLPVSQIENAEYSFIKILTNHNNHIVGATIVSPNASLIASELSLAMRHNLSILEIASTPHLINGPAYAIKLAVKNLI